MDTNPPAVPTIMESLEQTTTSQPKEFVFIRVCSWLKALP